MERREGERNIALRLMYDGSAYHGWQVQKTEITVAEILRCTEGTLSPVHCSSLEGDCCERADSCRSLPLWLALDRHVDSFLTGISLEDVLLGKIG